MADVKVTYWGEIPCSVMVKAGRGNRANVQLPKIYMVTVDAVATKKGMVSADEYAKGFRVEKIEHDGEIEDIQAFAQQLADELVEKYPREWLWAQRDAAGIDAVGQDIVEKEAAAGEGA